MLKLNFEIVEIMADSHSFKEAGDLLCTLEGYQLDRAVELFNKGNQFFSAIREAMKEKVSEKRAAFLASTKNSVNLAYDVKKN